MSRSISVAPAPAVWSPRARVGARLGTAVSVLAVLVAACARRVDVPQRTAAANLPADSAVAVAWAGLPAERKAGDVVLAPDVLVRLAAPGLWQHVTLGQGAYRGYPSNGLMLVTPDGGAVLFDTGWTDEQTEILLRWAAARGHPVRRAVITHAHVDRLGGLGALHARGVPAVSLPLTASRARSEGLLPAAVPAPDSVPGLARDVVRDAAEFELLYPGPGHAPDNVIAYFPRQRVLFGGCLVRSDTATTVGNVADADLAHWPRAVARVRVAYPEARLVVPGHGGISSIEALSVTERLVTARGAAVDRVRDQP